MKSRTNALLITVLVVLSVCAMGALYIANRMKSELTEEERGNTPSSTALSTPSNGGTERPPNKGPVERLLRNELVQRAREATKGRATCDTTEPPAVSEHEDFTVVTFWMHEDPFRTGARQFDSKVTIDQRTGEILEIKLAQGGTSLFTLDPKSAGQKNEASKQNLVRVRQVGAELNRRVRLGLPLSDNLSEAARQTARIAREHATARDRRFDIHEEPMVVAIDGISIVTLWRCSEDLEEGHPSYAARVFIDIAQQSVIGMEVSD